MADGLTPVGIQFSIEGEQRYLKAMESAQKSINAFERIAVTGFANAADAASKFNIVTIALGTALGQMLYRQGARFVGFLTNMPKMAIESAGRLDELNLVAHMMGTRLGYTNEEIDNTIRYIRQWGIEAETATNLIIQLSRAGAKGWSEEGLLGVSRRLADVAKDAAVIAGANTTETLDRIIHGIMTMNTQVLRYGGITVNAMEEQNKLAKSLGKTVNQLTIAERQQALYNAVLAEGAKIQGAYAMAMESGYKLMGSNKRVLNDIIIALGKPFQQAYFHFAKTLYEGGKIIGAALGEDLKTGAPGKLADELLRLGAVASVVMEAIGKKTIEGTRSFIDFVDRSSAGLEEFAVKAFGYGINIVAQLAAGIVQGISLSLTWAMNSVSSVLEWFLAPGSPPRIAPNIDDWGASAFTEYLKGFTQADYGVFDSVQSQLKSVMSVLTGAGFMSGKEADSLFQSLSKEMSRLLAEGGDTQSFIDRIRNSFGQFGEQLAYLTEEQMKLAAATEDSQKAQEALKRTMEAEQAAYADIARIEEEYNALVLSGASQEAIEQKRAEYELAKNKARQAREERREATRNYQASVEGLDAMRERVDMQSRLIAQLIEMSQVQSKLVGGVGGGIGGIEGIPEIEGAFEIPKPIKNEALENAKLTIQNFMKDALKPWNDAVEKYMKPAIKNVEDSFGRLKTVIYDIRMLYIEPLIDRFKGLIPTQDIIRNAGAVIGVLSTISVAMTAVKVASGIAKIALGGLSLPMAGVIAGIALVATAWQTNFGGIRDIVTDLWENTLQPFVGFVVEKVGGLWVAIQPMVENVVTGLTSFLVPAFKFIETVITTVVMPVVKTLFSFIDEHIAPLVEKIGLAASQIFGVIGTVAGKILEIGTRILEFLSPAFEAVLGVAEKVLGAVADIIGKIVELVGNAAGALDLLLTGNDKIIKEWSRSNQQFALEFKGTYEEYVAYSEQWRDKVLKDAKDAGWGITGLIDKLDILSEAQWNLVKNRERASEYERHYYRILAEHTNATKDAITVAELNLFMNGRLGEENLKHAKAVEELRKEEEKLYLEIQRLSTIPNKTPEQVAELDKLKGKYGEITQAIGEEEERHTKATRQIVFNILQQNAALSPDALMEIAKRWDMIDQDTYDAYQRAKDYRSMLDEGKITAQQFADLVAGIPAEKVFKMEADTSAIDNALKKYTGWTIAVGFTTSNVPQGQAQPQAKAAGGDVKRGATYLVGEEGAELFVPGMNGAILPNAVTEFIGSLLKISRKQVTHPLSGAMIRQVMTSTNNDSRSWNLHLHGNWDRQTVEADFALMRVLGA